MNKRIAAVCAAVLACAVLPSFVSAHPHELGEVYVPWTDKLSERQWLASAPSTAAAPSRRGEAAGRAARGGMSLVGNADKDGTTNSDLAFWGNLAYAGNYSGFRILDASDRRPDATVVDFACNGPAERRLGARDGRQAVPVPVDRQRRRPPRTARAPNCADRQRRPRRLRGRARLRRHGPGAARKFIDMIQTACGSHTHSIIPDGDEAYIYVASYPLGSEHHAARARRRRTRTTAPARSRTRRSRSSRSRRRAASSSSSSRSSR